MTFTQYFNKYPERRPGSYDAYKERYGLGFRGFNQFIQNKVAELGLNAEEFQQSVPEVYFTEIFNKYAEWEITEQDGINLLENIIQQYQQQYQPQQYQQQLQQQYRQQLQQLQLQQQYRQQQYQQQLQQRLQQQQQYQQQQLQQQY